MAGLAALSKQGRGEDFARAVSDDPDSAPLTDRERALLVYCVKLNDAPGAMERGDVEALRTAGLSDAEILHANLVVGYFAFANRLTLGLGVELEPQEHDVGA